MGRIQRKKPTGPKKKKKQSVEKRSTARIQVATDRGVKTTALSEAATKENKKRQVLPAKKQPAATTPAAVKLKDGILNQSIQFLREVKIELKKVTWPSRKQTIGSTVVVIALVMLISLFLGVVDMGLSNLIRIVLQ